MQVIGALLYRTAFLTHPVLLPTLKNIETINYSYFLIQNSFLLAFKKKFKITYILGENMVYMKFTIKLLAKIFPACFTVVTVSYSHHHSVELAESSAFRGNMDS